MRRALFLSILCLLPWNLNAKPRAPFPDNAFDGGVPSAESLGRGNTFAAIQGTHAAGSENPASLVIKLSNATYATANVGQSSPRLTRSERRQNDPLQGKITNYVAVGAGSGLLYYEPLSRLDQKQITDSLNPNTDYRDVQLSADAFGFAGATTWKKGSFGISLAYLHASQETIEHQSGTADKSLYDTADGFRANMGFLFPLKSYTAGLVVQNAPSFLWWHHYKRNQLPVKVRVGNAWSIQNKITLSLDGDIHYYHEGSKSEKNLYFGAEWPINEQFVVRSGVFGPNLNGGSERHITGGLTYRAETGAKISYALERFDISNERVLKSVISLQIPIATDGSSPGK